jgi:hypothetical protein
VAALQAVALAVRASRTVLDLALVVHLVVVEVCVRHLPPYSVVLAHNPPVVSNAQPTRGQDPIKQLLAPREVASDNGGEAVAAWRSLT